eukprot:5878058-Prymnesium_polylepis.1
MLVSRSIGRFVRLRRAGASVAVRIAPAPGAAPRASPQQSVPHLRPVDHTSGFTAAERAPPGAHLGLHRGRRVPQVGKSG